MASCHSAKQNHLQGNTLSVARALYAAHPLWLKSPKPKVFLGHSTMLSRVQAQLPKLLDMTLKQCSNDPSKIISRELYSVCGVMFWAQDWIRMLRVHKNSSEGRKWFWPTTSDLCRILTHWCSEVGAWCLVLITRTQRPSLVQPWADYWPQDGGGLISTSW